MGFMEQAKLIPHRMQQVLINWIFMVASAALILDFAALHMIFVRPTSYFAELCNWFGVLSCLCWFLGFVLLSHWLRSVGATAMGQAGCYFKLIAAVFFNLQPMTGTMADLALGGASGLWWSNLTGILLFHTGNLVSCVDFYLHTPPGANKRKGWIYHGNLPITAMWVYQLSTWFLVAANFVSCTFNGASWAPLVPVKDPRVLLCQLTGGFLLLIGSIIYTVWCDGFRNLSH